MFFFFSSFLNSSSYPVGFIYLSIYLDFSRISRMEREREEESTYSRGTKSTGDNEN